MPKDIIRIIDQTPRSGCARLQAGSTMKRIRYTVASEQHSPADPRRWRFGSRVVHSRPARPDASSSPSCRGADHEHKTITRILGAVPPRPATHRPSRFGLLESRNMLRAAARGPGRALTESAHRAMQLGDRDASPTGSLSVSGQPAADPRHGGLVGTHPCPPSIGGWASRPIMGPEVHPPLSSQTHPRPPRVRHGWGGVS